MTDITRRAKDGTPDVQAIAIRNMFDARKAIEAYRTTLEELKRERRGLIAENLELRRRLGLRPGDRVEVSAL